MSSPGRPGRLNTPDRLVGDVKGQTGPREPAGSLSLSRSGLTRVADCVLKTSSLQVSLEEQFRGFEVPLGAECFRNGAFSCLFQYLYLEGNRISDVPHSLFASLPNLLWLDLRNNHIRSLPAQIGSHR